MKICLVLSGHFRTADLPPVRDALRKYVIDPYNPDIYVATWNKRGSSKWANDSGIDPEWPVYGQLLEETYGKHLVGWSCSPYGEFLRWYKDHPSLINNIHNSFPQFYLLQKAYQLLRFSGRHYDVIIWSRPDFIYTAPIPEKSLVGGDIINQINAPPAFYANRIYMLWLASGQRVFQDYAQNLFERHAELRNVDMGNGLTPDDPCNMAYAYLKDKYPIMDAEWNFGDIYR